MNHHADEYFCYAEYVGSRWENEKKETILITIRFDDSGRSEMIGLKLNVKTNKMSCVDERTHHHPALKRLLSIDSHFMELMAKRAKMWARSGE